MDTIFIEGLAVDTVIGVYEWERDIRQRVVLDIDMRCDTRVAAADDDVKLALDYGAVAQRVAGFVASSRCALVETLAEGVAVLILEEFRTDEISLRINKPAALDNAAGVGVRITRSRHP